MSYFFIKSFILPCFMSGISFANSIASIAFSAVRKIAILDPAPIKPSKIIKLAIIIKIVSANPNTPAKFNFIET